MAWSIRIGKTVQIQLLAFDPDAGQDLILTASGGLFEDFFQQKAMFSAVSDTAVFTWTAQNEHVREQPHQIAFKVKEDSENNGLATFRVVRFRVLAVSGVSGRQDRAINLTIFPNPSVGTFRAELPAGAPSGASLRVVSRSGQVIRERPAQTDQTSHLLEAGDLPASLYFLQVVLAGQVLATEKFVKQ